MPELGRLTTGELSATITSLDWLVERMEPRGILEPAVADKLRTLLVDCHEEQSSRMLTAGIDTAIAGHEAWKAAGRPEGTVPHEQATDELSANTAAGTRRTTEPHTRRLPRRPVPRNEMP